MRGRLGSLDGVLDVVLSSHATGESSTHCVLLTRTRCHFGGRRVWFVCPQCERQAGVIYLAHIAGCWDCLQLRYPSSSKNAIESSWLKQDRIERKLARGSAPWDYRRPKGMHWKTFERTLREYCQVKKQRDDACAVFLTTLGLWV
jgi:hypothetical protein